MKQLKNLENALVVAELYPNFYGSKVYAMYHVTRQVYDKLYVNVVWDMRQTDKSGVLNYDVLGPQELDVNDVCFCVQALTPVQEAYFGELGIDYRFHKDEDALERLALHLDMDLNNIGYDGEPDEGTWFTCCRIGCEIQKILPEGFHIYSLRASDEDDSQPASIEEKVVVNHYGDILTDKPLQVPVELEVENIEYDEEGNIIS